MTRAYRVVMGSSSRITTWLDRAPAWAFALFACGAGFSTYFCMYAFRKPFAAAEYAGLSFWGSAVALKTAFVISQVLGYTLSKYVGMKVCAEITLRRRGWLLVGLIIAAELALVVFAVLPPQWRALAMVANGLPLGMVWGLVVSYLEGRRTSELLLAGLSCSFIVASGVVKDVGRFLLRGLGSWSVDEWWMPAATGALFLVPFLASVWLLEQLPRPSDEDVLARAAREPMDSTQRWAFVKRFWPGLALLLVVYLFLTAFRDFRDNYGVEIFRALGHAGHPAIFTRTEIPVALGVLGVMAALNLVRDNRRGLQAAFAVMAAGLLLLGGATALLDSGRIHGMTWMVLVGLGSYLAYVPFGSVLFDRLMAHTRAAGNAVFAIYLMDAVGYSGSVGTMIFKDVSRAQLSHLGFIRWFAYGLATAGAVIFVIAGLYFTQRHLTNPPPMRNTSDSCETPS
jgi:Family of unknown function (DUF5690)